MTLKEQLENAPHLKKCRFNKEKHKYYYCDKPVFNMKYAEEWTGITTLIGKYKKPFDRDKISKGVAFRDGKTQEEVLSEWDENLDNSLVYGNLVHDSFEDLMNTGVINPEVEKELTLMNDQLALYGLTPLKAEYLVSFPEIKRASCIDLVCQDEEGKLVVIDFKTPEKGIKFEAYKDQKMLHPVSNLLDASYYHYSLQITFYANKLKDLGFPVADQHYLLYIRNEDCYPIPTLDLTTETKKIIQIENYTL